MAALATAAELSGVVVDDDEAEFTGEWVKSAKQPALVGDAYRHDNNQGRGAKFARFTPDLPAAGEYEVRLLYPAHPNRAANVAVTILSAEGERTVSVNQREEPTVNGVPRALGVFRFNAGREGAVTISNAGANGFVVADGVQFVPVEVARAERAAARRPKTVRLLTVGNSFSLNATQFLGEIAAAAGNVLVHHPVVISGGAMAQHWEKVERHERDSQDPAGLYPTQRSLRQELLAEPWDYVTIQQASLRSHDVASYRPFARRLHNYIKRLAPQAEVLVHQTWAYRCDDPRFTRPSAHPGQPATQQAMHDALTRAYETTAAELGARIIPSGDAFHLADTDPTWGYQPDATFDFKNARPPALPAQAHSLHIGWHWKKGADGKATLGMDGHHANAAGQYLAACVFYESLFGESAVGNAFAPKGIAPAHARFLQETAHRAVSEGRARKPAMVRPAAVKPEDVDGKSFDLVVVGGTASGVACAVRAAREGCSVLLAQHNQHLGGMMVNGLMQWDALYGGHRAPLFSELLRTIERHYRAEYGEESRDYQVVRYTHEHYPTGWAEPHVAEREFNRLVVGEENITVLLGYYPTAVERDGAILRTVTLREYGGAKDVRVRGAIFADATYEGDLFALAKVPYRVGREGRDEYNEPHAGKVFCNIAKGPAPTDAVEGRLNIHPYGSRQGTIDPDSPFTADGAVQAYNFRFCVSKDPANRIMLTEPPPGYNREEYVHYERKGIATNAGPNRKSHMNSPILPGENHDYPEADWPTREKIIRRHLNFALGLIWFLQNDESVPPDKQANFREWGLAKDEFTDNNHVPYEMYVREARRIVGRHVFTERDNSLAPALGRTPIHPDSVAISDWYMDSHSCTTDSRPGFRYDGKLILTEESRPAQIPYRALLPQGVDNLLVPVCLSATHVAWGAVRLEPVWMQTGEAAGLAAALAKREKTTPADLDPDLLLRALVERRQLVTFFNDVLADGAAPWVPAAQYFGTKGFFHDYNARPLDPLKRATGRLWVEGLTRLRQGTLDPNALARAVAEAEGGKDDVMSAAEFRTLLPGIAGEALPPAVGPITRGAALQALFHR
ncbi:MAG: FAD-dependent oxidoreductase [Planctomycetota bacterium]